MTGPASLRLWAAAEAWLAAIMGRLAVTTMGPPVNDNGDTVVFVSPKSPPIEERPAFASTWVHQTAPSFTATPAGDSFLIAGVVDAELRCRVRYGLTIPEADPVPAPEESIDAAIVQACLWAVTTSWQDLPAKLTDRLGGTFNYGTDLSVNSCEVAGTGYSWGVDASITVRMPIEPCEPADG